MHKEAYRNLLTQLSEEKDDFHLARVKNIAAYGACVWKTVAPFDYYTRCSDLHYRINARLNLGVLPHSPIPTICGARGCTAAIDNDAPSSIHLLCCKYISSSVIARHDAIQQVIEDVAHSVGYVVKRHVRNRDNANNTAVDSTLTLGADTFDIDYTVTASTAPSCRHASANHPPLHRVHLAEQHKTTHHRGRASINDSLHPDLRSNVPFHPFSVDIYGGIGKSAKDIMHMIALASESHTCINLRADTVRTLKHGVAMAICRGNAECVLQCLRNAAAPNAQYRHKPRVMRPLPKNTRADTLQRTRSMHARARYHDNDNNNDNDIDTAARTDSNNACSISHHNHIHRFDYYDDDVVQSVVVDSDNAPVAAAIPAASAPASAPAPTTASSSTHLATTTTLYFVQQRARQQW